MGKLLTWTHTFSTGYYPPEVSLTRLDLEHMAERHKLRFLLIDEAPGKLNLRVPSELTRAQYDAFADEVRKRAPSGLTVSVEVWPYR